MAKKNNSITLILPTIFEDTPIKIVKSSKTCQVLIDIETENIEAYSKDCVSPIFVYTDGSYIRIIHDKIIYIEANGSYCRIVYDGLKSLILSFPLSEACKMLPANFVRVHRSYAVNLDYITRISGNRLYVKDTWINIGREYREKTFARFVFFHTKRY